MRNIDFGVANFQVLRKTRRKISILKLQSIKIEEVSHEMLVLMLPRVSSRVSGFLWPRHVYGGSCKTFPFRRFPSRLSSFCVAGAALRDIPICLMTCRNWFCVAGSKLLLRFHKMSCTSRGRRSILEISVIIYVASAALQTCRIACSRLHTPCSTLPAPHSTIHTPHLTLYTFYSTLHTLHFTLYTLHSTLYTLHFTLLTSHSTIHTPHFTLYTFTLHTPHSTLYTPRHTPHFTLHTLHSTHCTLYSRFLTPQFTLHTITLCSLHSTLHTLRTTLPPLHFTLHTPHFTL